MSTKNTDNQPDTVEKLIKESKSIQDLNSTVKMLAHTALNSDPPDYKFAFINFKNAAENGNDAEAQYNLATLYATGKGVDKDLLSAAFWFNKAEEQGDAQAGKCKVKATWDYFFENIDQWDEYETYKAAIDFQILLYGKQNADDKAKDLISGISANLMRRQDYAKSLKCYRAMAEFGNDDTSMFNLGLIYMQGFGTAINQLAALYWFDKAADLGNKQAKTNRDLVFNEFLKQKKGPVEATMTLPGKFSMDFKAKSIFGVLSVWCKFGSDGVMLDEEKSKYWEVCAKSKI